MIIFDGISIGVIYDFEKQRDDDIVYGIRKDEFGNIFIGEFLGSNGEDLIFKYNSKLTKYLWNEKT